MTEEQLKKLRMINSVADVLNIDHLQNKQPRTLLFGFDSDRATVHVYLCRFEKRIVTAIYGGYENISPQERTIQSNKDYIPTKRLYPDKCDFEFCKLLTERGVPMTFTNYQDSKDEQFYGTIL